MTQEIYNLTDSHNNEFVIPFAYNKKEHIQCCWQRITEGTVPHKERHWLEYGVEYTVTDIGEHDTGGMLSLLIPIPPEAEQFVIRRTTPKTQEIDLHNGARLPAELIEAIGDKVTMLVQEVSEQIITEEEGNNLKLAWRETVSAAIEEVETHIENGIEGAHEAIAAETQERQQGDETLGQAIAEVADDLEDTKTEYKNYIDIRDGEVLTEAKNYANTEIANTVVATQTWLPAVDTVLPTITDTSRIWLCRRRDNQTVYQCVAGQTSWVEYSDQNDFVNEQEMEAAISEHNESGEAHEDIREALSVEEQARKDADDSLLERLEALAPDGLDNLPQLFAQEAQARQNGDAAIVEQLAGKAPIASPTFTGTPKVPTKTSAATSDGTLIATEAQVALKANIASPALTGTPTATTAAAKNNSTRIATTAYADRAGHPVGSYYTQYPVEGQSTIANMFPSSETPATLFGGTWTEMYASEDVFFRTGALGSRRGQVWNNTSKVYTSTGATVGVEPDAVRNFLGSTNDIGNIGNYISSHDPTGVIRREQFPANNTGVGNGNGQYGNVLTINASRDVPTDTTNHPKNRLIKVWKRTA